MIDAMAALRQTCILDDGGGIVGKHPDIAEVDGKRVAVLAPGVTFTQHDVRAVQLAKAAISTGVELLLRDRGLAEGDIELVVIAGAFGAYIDVGSATTIGLLPALRLDRFKQVGNAAGVGVRQLLASRKALSFPKIISGRMVETSLEAVALCGASLLSGAFTPVPSPSGHSFLNSSPQAEPSVQISRTGLPR